MCPLRYVLVLISVLVALLLLWWPAEWELHEGGDKDKRPDQSVSSTLWDWGSGRYLIRVYRASVRRQEALALANAGGESIKGGEGGREEDGE